ncbi:MAG: hypothetical protein ACRDE6_05485 [Candidatus Limnocylindria bacterium]
MATPKPGEIRCPTCHRSTPPAAFCTQCGSAIPSDARIRPRGMDRDELQDRIRARRSGGGDPYRRGGVADEDAGGYQRFQPEPQDAQARRSRRPDERRWDSFDERSAAAGGAAAGGGAIPGADASDRPDITREADDWQERQSIVPPIAPSEPVAAPPPPPPVDEPAYIDNYDDAAYDEAAYPYEYDEWDDGRGRRPSGAGAFAILGFLALGVLALLGGAVLAGVFSDPNIGGVDPTLTPSPSIQASTAPSEAASAAPSSDASAGPSGQPPSSGDPVVFPDGFTAEAQPCIPGSVRPDGCDSNGGSNSGQVEIWVGFSNGSPSDVLGVAIVDSSGDTIGDVSLDLESIDCTHPCRGYTFFNFGNLPVGAYEVRVTRNGELASSTSFEVS